MGGGIMQLVIKGNQDLQLTGNPQISFFAAVYKMHYNFSMESKRLEFNKTMLYLNENTQYSCKILRHADLVSKMFICMTIPDIYSNGSYKFKWVPNFGEVLIDNVEMYIGGSLIDRHYGEWLHIWNELTLPKNKKDLYNKMIGNTEDMYNPIDKNTGFYPSSIAGISSPSIIGRQIIIPLNFWFNSNIGLALPLIGIQYQPVEIRVEFKKIYDLYLIYEGDKYVRPNVMDINHIFFNFVDTTKVSLDNNYIEIDPYIEANYIWVENKEREYFAKQSIEFLIEQVTRIDNNYIKNKYNIFDLHLFNPVKELLWVIKRSDNNINNTWFNFSDDNIPNKKILLNAKIILNGQDRIEEKNAGYFNLIQAYKHHNNTLDGLYIYSFALKPELFQPSGSCNMSVVNKIQLYLETNVPFDNTYDYELSVYAISYNFLRMISGSANVAFSL